MRVIIRQKGSFKNTERFLSRAQQLNVRTILSNYGSRGVTALADATPLRTGDTATSWSYKISVNRYGYSLGWYNSNKEYGAPVAILIQYGHGTRNGGYVQGIDYINPAMRPIFQGIADDIWKEVTRL